LLLRTGDTYPSATGEVHGSFISKKAQRAQHSVPVDIQDRRKVNRRRKSFTGLDLTVRDGFSDLRGDLIVKGELLRSIYLDIQHGAM
jgi:hypothetical protein